MGGSPYDRRAGPGDDRTEDELWGYVPVTVLFVVVFAGLFTVIGLRPFQVHTGGGIGLTDVQNALQIYVFNVFMHSGLEHYLLNMLLLVLFGSTLTMLTTNAHVAGVILVAHAGGSLFVQVAMGGVGIGASLAVAGLIAATIVRTGALLLGRVDASLIKRLLGGTVALGVIGVFFYWSLEGVLFLRVADHHVGGWVCGALAEMAWISWAESKSQ